MVEFAKHLEGVLEVKMHNSGKDCAIQNLRFYPYNSNGMSVNVMCIS